ncbi:HalOD1 output domain-containing protein [Halosimplex amylolyticum]|uniref:HalOD1 output domain-containing protein n=1 Tax=Halosimplex amylolyticum TaxID=3396616 RepID=UPI003F57C562
MTAIDDWTVTNAYGDDPPSVAIVRAVAAATDQTVTDLRPLFHVVDSDSLDRLFDGEGDPSVRFRYEGCDVTVNSTYVLVRAADDAARPPNR